MRSYDEASGFGVSRKMQDDVRGEREEILEQLDN
jgi:hypothetical protein